MTASRESKVQALVAIGQDVHARGWVPATSGNFSSRLEPCSVLVTASGSHKGALMPQDFLAIDLDGKVLDSGTDGRKPSAETPLHLQLYRWQPWIGCVLHCHSAGATVLSMHERASAVQLHGYELLKAFRGRTSHDTTVTVPIFENTQDIPALAAVVQQTLNESSVAYLIRGHGLYVWGGSETECLRHLEALDFLLDCELQRRLLQRP